MLQLFTMLKKIQFFFFPWSIISVSPQMSLVINHNSQDLPGCLAGGGVEEDRYHEDCGEDPGAAGDQPRDGAGPEPRRGDRVADGDVAVRGEQRHEERARDLVDGGGGEVELAHGGAEGPLPQVHGGQQEGDAHQEAAVGHGEVQDVGVGDGVHLGEAQDDEDDERVAEEAGQADEQVEHLADEQV